MFLQLLKAYEEQGYYVHIGNNHQLCAGLISKSGQRFDTGGGIGITDVAFLLGLRQVFNPQNIICIGNASGYGTFCIAEIFENAYIDVMDAEVNGKNNSDGSELTRKISSKYYNNRVSLITGFCPQDLNTYFSEKQYDL